MTTAKVTRSDGHFVNSVLIGCAKTDKLADINRNNNTGFVGRQLWDS
jgi:hypothetical protein